MATSVNIKWGLSWSRLAFGLMSAWATFSGHRERDAWNPTMARPVRCGRRRVMYRQLKQTALPCRLGGEHFGSHYGPPGADRPLPDVQRRVGVCVRGMAARDALEGGLVGSVALVDATARAALARRVARINEADRDAQTLGLVNYKIAKLGKRPITKPCSLVAAGRYPLSDALEIFKSDSARGAFSIRNERLRYDVVCVGLESPLLPGQFAKFAFGGFGAALLQSLATAAEALADALDLDAGVAFPVTVGCKTDNAEIDAKPILCVELVGFRHVASSRQIPLPANETEIDFTFLEGHQAPLVVAHNHRYNDAALQGPNAGGRAILDEAKDAFVVGLGRVGAEGGRDLAVDFESIRYLGDGSHHHLGRQTKAGPGVGIGKFVQVELAEAAARMAHLRKPRRGFVAPGERPRKASGLIGRRQEFHGRYEFHQLKYRGKSFVTQDQSRVARSAFPLSPEGDSLSRRNHE